MTSFFFFIWNVNVIVCADILKLSQGRLPPTIKHLFFFSCSIYSILVESAESFQPPWQLASCYLLSSSRLMFPAHRQKEREKKKSGFHELTPLAHPFLYSIFHFELGTIARPSLEMETFLKLSSIYFSLRPVALICKYIFGVYSGGAMLFDAWCGLHQTPHWLGQRQQDNI